MKSVSQSVSKMINAMFIFSKDITKLKKLLIVFFVALILRLSFLNIAHHGDLNNNISWGNIAYERGLNGFYEGEGLPRRDSGEGNWPVSAPNQPPLTILMFSGVSFLWHIIEEISWNLNERFQLFPSAFIWFWESKGMIFLVKLPSVLADLGIGFLIYNYLIKKDGTQKTKNEKYALIIAAAWLFNPISWYNSSVWGQTDSVVNLLGLIAILQLFKKNFYRFISIFTTTLLFKGSLVIFIPVLFWLILKQKYSIQKWIKGLLASLFLIVLSSIWFHPKIDLFSWLIKLYKDRILPGEIGYLTANAFNFWWLVDPGKIFDSTLFLGLSARIWGYLFTLSLIILLIARFKKDFTEKKIFIALILTTLSSFLFMTRIHERYLYPFFPISTMLLVKLPLFWIYYTVLSLTYLLNMYHLFWAPSIPFLESIFRNSWFMDSIAIINIIIFVILLRKFIPLRQKTQKKKFLW